MSERPPASDFDRRDFLKSVGFGVTAALAASCRRAPAEKAIPFLVQPEETVPGEAVWYASACAGCAASCGALAKTRDGRPIKLEGNPDHPLSRGGLCAVGQASILGLYDSRRLEAPRRASRPTDWAEIDRTVPAALEEIARRGGRIRWLTGTVTSPTEARLLARFDDRLRRLGADVAHVVYDPLSASAILDAHRATHGVRALPRYRFDRADVVVSFDADFLGTWIAPVEHTAGYRDRRRPDGETDGTPRMSHHVQLEGRMSLTGSNADLRARLLPGEVGLALSHLVLRLAALAGGTEWAPRFAGLPEPPLPAGLLDELAHRLWVAGEAEGRALVVAGSQNLAVQVLANAANHLLGSYGSTLELDRPSYRKQGDDHAIERLLGELRAKRVDALLVRGVDPVAELPGGAELAAAIARLPLAVDLADHLDSTARACGTVCPEPHFLETWHDAEPVAGVATVGQPVIRPLGATRPLVETLGAWMGEPATAYDRVRSCWREALYPRRTDSGLSFQRFWDLAVHDGVTSLATEPLAVAAFDASTVRPVARAERPAPGRFALALYPTVALLDGRHAENPWLQELPDPVTKATWDNYACLSPVAARELGVATGDVVRVGLEAVAGAAGGSGPEPLELPVYVEPGQHDRLVAIALGYGRVGTSRFADLGPRWIEARPTVEKGGAVGVNASPLLALHDGALRYDRVGVSVFATGATRPLAMTQRYDRQTPPASLSLPGFERGAEAREAARATTLAALVAGGDSGSGSDSEGEPRASLWAEHAYPGHHWGMAIDLTACTGCSACVVACQAENNVPVVGRDEVLREREMHWLRIDRYVSGEGDEVAAIHQPMLCQQCDHAPCETVCPVLATVHSSEGLNQQVYNRCVGTRYCANNCPYKVRRFNWFRYSHDDRLANLALNPDVTVRSRGVMEKCSFCVQRIQEAKSEAKAAGRPLADGAIRTACEQSCPAQAIVFGDLADPTSRVAKLVRGRRAYRVLEELNVEPSVAYLERVRNPDDHETEDRRA